MVSINPEIMNGGGPLSKTGYVEPEDVKSAEVSAVETTIGEGFLKFPLLHQATP